MFHVEQRYLKKHHFPFLIEINNLFFQSIKQELAPTKRKKECPSNSKTCSII